MVKVVKELTKKKPLTVVVVKGAYADLSVTNKAQYALDSTDNVAICAIEELEEVLCLLSRIPRVDHMRRRRTTT